MAFDWRFRNAVGVTARTLAFSLLLLGVAPAQEGTDPIFPSDPSFPADPDAPIESAPLDPVTPAEPAPDAETSAPVTNPKPQRIKNPIAEFAGLDKITGRIISFDVYIDETVQFGALQVTPRVCYSRPKEEEPKTDSFVEVDEITLDRKIQRIFTGWMFAESPGLNAVEHAVYDVWLKACKQKSEVPPPETPKTN